MCHEVRELDLWRIPGAKHQLLRPRLNCKSHISPFIIVYHLVPFPINSSLVLFNIKCQTKSKANQPSGIQHVGSGYFVSHSCLPGPCCLSWLWYWVTIQTLFTTETNNEKLDQMLNVLRKYFLEYLVGDESIFWSHNRALIGLRQQIFPPKNVYIELTSRYPMFVYISFSLSYCRYQCTIDVIAIVSLTLNTRYPLQ